MIKNSAPAACVAVTCFAAMLRFSNPNNVLTLFNGTSKKRNSFLFVNGMGVSRKIRELSLVYIIIFNIIASVLRDCW